MPHKDPDIQDPMVRVGVEIDCPDDSATQEMAECFVQEFLRLGVEPEAVLEMFRQPNYAAAHKAYLALGEEAIRDLVATYREVCIPVKIIDNPCYEPDARDCSACAQKGDALDT